MRVTNRNVHFGIAVAIVLTGLHGSARAVVPVRTVALTFTSAPGTGIGVNFSNFQSVFLDDQGRCAFQAILAGVNVNSLNNTGVWAETYGVLSLAAREGSLAPGAGVDANFDQFSTVQLSPQGDLVIRATMTGSSVNQDTDAGIWTGLAGSLVLQAQKGMVAPGTAGGVVFGVPGNPSANPFLAPSINSSGRVVFSASVLGNGVDGTNDRGVWSDASGSLELVARKGDPAPGLGANAVLGNFGDVQIDDAGGAAFVSFLAGSAVDATNNQVVWGSPAGVLTAFGRKGSPAPLIGGELFGDTVGPVTINRLGRLSFVSMLSGISVTDNNRFSIWTNVSGPLNLLARAGQAAPGTGPGVVFLTLNSQSINAAGEIVFDAFLRPGIGGVDASNDYGAWSTGLGGLHKVYREGDPAPGTGPGVFFDIGITFIGNSGRAVIAAALKGAVDASNDFGIWQEDGAGGLNLIAREGEEFEALPGVMKTLSLILNTAVNANDQIAFTSEFTDGTMGALVTVGPDADGDGVTDAVDNCPNVANLSQEDTDGDGRGDACDGCPADPLKTAAGFCGCGVVEADNDADGVADCLDNCPSISNAGQDDDDGDGLGNSCDDGPSSIVPGPAGNPPGGDPAALSTSGCCAPGTPSVVGTFGPLGLLGLRARTRGRRLSRKGRLTRASRQTRRSGPLIR